MAFGISTIASFVFRIWFFTAPKGP